MAKPLGADKRRKSTTPSQVFGRAVTEMRLAQDASQATLAAKLGYSNYYLGRIERGQANITCDVMAAILYVQSAVALNFVLPVGATSESITVDSATPALNTTDASVSTVVDQKFVENIPLNGRSFQDLISMTPGVVTQSPQNTSQSVGNSGDFSVNGQRTQSNYYTVDGVSANISSGSGNGIGGAATVSSKAAANETQPPNAEPFPSKRASWDKGRFRYAPAPLIPRIFNFFTPIYWPTFAPPYW